MVATQDSPNPDASTVTSDDKSSNTRTDRNAGKRGNWPQRGQKRKDIGRSAYNRSNLDKRQRNADQQERNKRQRVEGPESSTPSEPSYMSIQFPKEEIEAESRKPKRKVAVMIGYAGTGYHGMQINHKDKTIEGDIFAAFVAAGAISKANADDPKKSSFVRCARTDKGVHAAGNVISLKLIIEDNNVVQKINDNLPPQIRVWGIERTSNSFSCYQTCDSRWYEYLMPSYCLLPPHHDSYIGKKIVESAKEKGVYDEYLSRLDDVKDYWEKVEKERIQPILDALDPESRAEVERRLHSSDDRDEAEAPQKSVVTEESSKEIEEKTGIEAASTEKASDAASSEAPPADAAKDAAVGGETVKDPQADTEEPKVTRRELTPAEIAIKQIKAAYIAAKREYRITPDRLKQLQDALNMYTGTHNYHNYTVLKTFKDPSAKRHIKSFIVNPDPVQINDTQWLSLKVHGQSFMMHQIRKMVAMAVLVVRCGTPLERIKESYTDAKISIPKAPGLGLLLERPVFESYNKKAEDTLGREKIEFVKFEKDMNAFKDDQIYKRIFESEEKENSFHTFFHQIDNFKTAYFLWVTAAGFEAATKRLGPGEAQKDGEDTEKLPDALQLGLEEGDDAQNGEG